jgi:hypothetical protein
MTGRIRVSFGVARTILIGVGGPVLPNRSLSCLGVVPQTHARSANMCSRRSINGR